MKCQNCGGYIKRRDTFCPHCGEKLQFTTDKPSHNKDKQQFGSDHNYRGSRNREYVNPKSAKEPQINQKSDYYEPQGGNSENFNKQINPEQENYKPQRNMKSNYKPLQQRYLRGEYSSSDEDFYNQYLEDQFIDEKHYQNLQNSGQDHSKRSGGKKYRSDDQHQKNYPKNYQDRRYSGKGNYHNDNQYNQKPGKKYRGYDLSAYYPDEEETTDSGMGMLPVILILLIALLIGFIIGIMMFTNSSLPSFG